MCIYIYIYIYISPTQEVAKYTNDTVGGLLNATFGNITELILNIMSLKAREFEIYTYTYIYLSLSLYIYIYTAIQYCLTDNGIVGHILRSGGERGELGGDL